MEMGQELPSRLQVFPRRILFWKIPFGGECLLAEQGRFASVRGRFFIQNKYECATGFIHKDGLSESYLPTRLNDRFNGTYRRHEIIIRPSPGLVLPAAPSSDTLTL